MSAGRRWTVRDRYGHDIYLTDERWNHITGPDHHPEMLQYEESLKETLQSGMRKQDPLNPFKYRYTKSFNDLAKDNTHIVAVVLFRFGIDGTGKPFPNNYVVTAFQKEIG